MEDEMLGEVKEAIRGLDVRCFTGDPNFDFGDPTKEALEELVRVFQEIFEEEEEL